MPVFFISADQIRENRISITGRLHQHLKASLRYRVGDELWVGDERRRRFRIHLSQVDGRRIIGEVLEQIEGPAPKSPSLILGPALLKGERMDWVIQKATELGVAGMIPLVSSQTVVRPRADRAESQRQRWEQVVLEAAQQSERWDVPNIGKPCSFDAFCKAHASTTARLILQERQAKYALGSIPLPRRPNETIVLVVGPEGGWREEEIKVAEANGFVAVTLGSRILRAETATLAALAILQSRLSELG
jgi:16S rRNA (uracil1498-N3)-methyltransferase